VSQGVWGDGLLKFRSRGGATDGALENGFVEVVAANFLARWIGVRAGRRKDPLPHPRVGGIGISAVDWAGQGDGACSQDDVSLVLALDGRQVRT